MNWIISKLVCATYYESSSFRHIRVSDNCLIHFVSELAKYIHLDKTTTSFIIDVSCIVYL